MSRFKNEIFILRCFIAGETSMFHSWWNISKTKQTLIYQPLSFFLGLILSSIFYETPFRLIDRQGYAP